jgi:TetR/AcrR family transcriptional regulator
MQRLMLEELDSASSPELRDSVRQWNRVPVDYYAGIKALDDGGELVDFDPLFLHLAVIGISDFFTTGEPLLRLLVPDGTDMDELAARYEVFVERLLMDGLRHR